MIINDGNLIPGCLLTSTAIVTLGIGMYMKNKNKHKKINPEEQELNDNAQNMVVDRFLEYIDQNNNITIEQAILKFEKSHHSDLDKFAKEKGRTKESYLRSYTDLFNIAKALRV